MRPLLLLFVPLMFAAVALSAQDYFTYVGTYTGPNSKGIYAYRFHPSTGILDSLDVAAETPNPTYLAVHPSGRFLYAVNETDNFGGKKSGSIAAYALDPHTGKLTFLNQAATRGGGPCHLAIDATGKALVAANYNGGSVASFPFLANGRLGEAASFIQHSGSSVDKERQEGPHAHSTIISADNRFVMVNDLGLDKIFVYRLDAAKATLTPNNPPFVTLHPGAGPRHFVFHPSAKFAYAINEMGNTVTAFAYDVQRGSLRELQTVPTLPADFTKPSTTAEITIDAKGKFLYGSNRGHDSISVFSIDASTGTLTPVERVPTGGKEPRNFVLDPSGAWLLAANQNSASIVVFHVDPNTGRLKQAQTVKGVDSPVSIVFVPVK